MLPHDLEIYATCCNITWQSYKDTKWLECPIINKLVVPVSVFNETDLIIRCIINIVTTYGVIQIISNSLFLNNRQKPAVSLLGSNINTLYTITNLKLSSAATVRVWREEFEEKDFTAQDIINGNLTHWLNGVTGRVKCWYDQSHNKNHLICNEYAKSPYIVHENNIWSLRGHNSCELTGNISLNDTQHYMLMRLLCSGVSAIEFEKPLLTGSNPLPSSITIGNGMPIQIKNATITWSVKTSKMWAGMYSEVPLVTGVNLIELGYSELREPIISINSTMSRSKTLDYGGFNDVTIPMKYNAVRMWEDVAFTDLLVCNTYIPENKQFNELSVLSFLRNLFD